MEPADRETVTGLPPGIAAAREELTPMLSQYADLCAAHGDALVLFQVGDFYEAFCEAAEAVARVCEVTLTERSDSTGDYPMAGIPIDNAAPYLESLLDAGYRVALGDQVEDAEQASGLVDRAVTEVITPGTVVEDDLLEAGTTNYVAAVTESDGVVGLAAVDVSTGECLVTSGDRDAVAGELDRIAPAELIAGPAAPAFEPSDAERGWETHEYDADAFDRRTAAERLEPYLPAPERRFDADAELRAAGAVLAYAEYTQGDDGPLSYVTRIRRYDPRDRLRLDAAAQRSLELFENRGLGASDTLFDALDETNCALGRRCLERWLRRPLVDADAIRGRHDAVGELADRSLAREGVADALATAYDLERLVSRVSRGRADARDLRSLGRTLAIVPELKATLAGADGEVGVDGERVADGGSEAEGDDDAEYPRTDRLSDLRDRLDELSGVRELIDDAIATDPPQEITEGGVICEGFDDDLDDLRATEREGRRWVADLEASERERTGIDSLSVGHNQVHGYYIEVTDANADRVPDDYRRRQTLKNSERYVTPELKEREEAIVGAAERADALEYELFVDVRERVASETERIQELADALAELDALASLATVAVEHDYVRPELRGGSGADADAGIAIEGGRHPVVERTEESFVPNDADLPRGSVAVITGPNMSGKSTYMRSVALAVVLAQTGSFVPAQAASLPVFDRVFTRVGASDDIAGGQSTFMREMSELTEILHDAGPDSLVLLDEVGRGTATTDGRAIARAAAEFLHDELGATALFATHYHELTDLADERERVFNLHFTATREDGDVTFLHRVVPGASSSSYGVEVAELAGVPGPVVDRARDLVAAEEGDRRGEPDVVGVGTGAGDPAVDGASSRGPSNQEPPDEEDEDGTDDGGDGTDDTDASLREFLAEESADDPGDGEGGPSGRNGRESAGSRADAPGDADRAVAPDAASEVVAALRDLDLARMTPIEALNALHDLQSRADDDG
ncbi:MULTISPECIES: DNA mismatch repair protein MutS [Halorubrum]|uniref:DNA mismatch repair protein MutS n=1 Tax=Halorubrum hochstenium ATCC 700873 TaxID=1227481 RepID=M0F9I8_9EURY|nr:MULTISPECIES: DNA mismatch repair protein MutS [Halorubrum]ELZ55912.1 DNA mismatch repair protein MutS [Halorubrum hochstenium ATCC 700873]